MEQLLQTNPAWRQLAMLTLQLRGLRPRLFVLQRT
jgi:hypothetical protein